MKSNERRHSVAKRVKVATKTKVAFVPAVRGNEKKLLALGPNVPVTFNLKDFIHKLFVQTLNVGAFFKGPGPLKIAGGFEYLDTCESPHSGDFRSYDVAYQRLFAIRYLAEEIMSKFDDGVSSDAKLNKALERFDFAESRCKLANARFSWDGVSHPTWANPRRRTPWLCPTSGETFSLDCLKAVRHARGFLQKLMVNEEDVVMKSIYRIDHGPGATTRLSRAEAHRTAKWSGSLHVTEGAKRFGEKFLEMNPGYADAGAQLFVYPGNLLAAVNKNYKTYRIIAAEPEMNMLAQKSLAVPARKWLERVGIDLTDQSRNREAARQAVFTEMTTQDSTVASDTNAKNVCSYLFPWWFYQHLMEFRSPVGFLVTKHGDREPVFVPDGKGGYTVSNGRRYEYEKISSMGNGNTFEVETLLFLGLARGACAISGSDEASVLVYGDDVVLPSKAWPLFREVLDFCGFVPNVEKTHCDGPFRESCGGHYWCATDVTPFYVREEVTHLDRLFLLHNNVWRWFDRNPGICDAQDVRVLLAWIRSHAPDEWKKPRLHRSDIGDGAFIGKPSLGHEPKNFWDKARELAPTRRYAGWEGFGVNTLQFESKADRLLDDCEHADRKAVFAGIWSGTRYRPVEGNVTASRTPARTAEFSETPWHQRYWSIRVQVYSEMGPPSWF